MRQHHAHRLGPGPGFGLPLTIQRPTAHALPLPRLPHPQVELHVTSIKCVSRAAALPFEVTDAARSAEAVKKAAEAGEVLPTVGQVRSGWLGRVWGWIKWPAGWLDGWRPEQRLT